MSIIIFPEMILSALINVPWPLEVLIFTNVTIWRGSPRQHCCLSICRLVEFVKFWEYRSKSKEQSDVDEKIRLFQILLSSCFANLSYRMGLAAPAQYFVWFLTNRNRFQRQFFNVSLSAWGGRFWQGQLSPTTILPHTSGLPTSSSSSSFFSYSSSYSWSPSSSSSSC